MCKIVEFKDINIKMAILKPGTYLVDGDVITVDIYMNNKVRVKNENDIRLVRTTKVIKHYLNVDDNTIISVSEYDNRLSELLEKRDEDYTWESLEDEFAYRKFERTYQKIEEDIQSISEPIKIEIESIKYNTGCSYIKNLFLNGKDKTDLFEYNQQEAWLGIVNECFKELGMSDEGDIHYSQTENKKVWGNSTHSCIRYVQAFGGFVFNDEFRNPYNKIGTLEDMLSQYNHDKNKIRKIIKTKYNKHFGKIDADDIDFVMVIDKLYSLRSAINSIESKKVTWSNQNKANKKVNEIIDYLESNFKEN